MKNTQELDTLIHRSETVFNSWKNVPGPERGKLILAFGKVLHEHKRELAEVITNEIGKTINESLGEVQEAIDMCEFASGLSRQLYGLTMPSERKNHRLQELWLPLGVVGIVTAFNFPVAVWAWNFCLAIICGNSVIWKPSQKGEKSCIAASKLWEVTCMQENKLEFDDLNLNYFGGNDEAIQLAAHNKISLLSATGSVEMGKVLAPLVSARLGKSLLELGGNNASIITPNANIDQAIKACTFAAVGTSGQRCTSLRRLFVHTSIIDEVVEKLKYAYSTISIGDPGLDATLMGPLISDQSYAAMQNAIGVAIKQGGTLQCGGLEYNATNYASNIGPLVLPCIITAPGHLQIMMEETFAPILYVVPYDNLLAAIDMVNSVTQGLSNSIFTENILEAEEFLKSAYSGIVNINTSTSGAEIGGAFGGEKDTGGGRESGSDSWKNYMRRVTSTVNYGRDVPLAQGIKFQ